MWFIFGPNYKTFKLLFPELAASYKGLKQASQSHVFHTYSKWIHNSRLEAPVIYICCLSCNNNQQEEALFTTSNT